MHLARLRRRVLKASREQFADRPDVVRQSLRHRRRDAKRLMDAAEIEMRDEQSDRCKMLINSLAEPIRQPREAARRHAERQVFPLSITR